MTDNRLSNDEFFIRLSALFAARRTSSHGSVFLTQKRLTPTSVPSTATSASPPPSSPLADLHPSSPLPVLIRATDGKDERSKKTKLSTVVEADELEGFFVKYAECWKGGMSGLKKRDRSGRKAKAKGKKKKEKEGDGRQDK